MNVKSVDIKQTKKQTTMDPHGPSGISIVAQNVRHTKNSPNMEEKQFGSVLTSLPVTHRRSLEGLQSIIRSIPHITNLKGLQAMIWIIILISAVYVVSKLLSIESYEIQQKKQYRNCVSIHCVCADPIHHNK